MTFPLSEIDEAASFLLSRLQGRTVVALRGDMGAGKTTLVAAVMRALGSGAAVSSPTFALVNDYGAAYHFDFYRIASPAEALDMGVLEYFDSGTLCLVEWPEKIVELLPEKTVFATLSVLPDGRRELEL